MPSWRVSSGISSGFWSSQWGKKNAFLNWSFYLLKWKKLWDKLDLILLNKRELSDNKSDWSLSWTKLANSGIQAMRKGDIGLVRQVVWTEKRRIRTVQIKGGHCISENQEEYSSHAIDVFESFSFSYIATNAPPLEWIWRSISRVLFTLIRALNNFLSTKNVSVNTEYQQWKAKEDDNEIIRIISRRLNLKDLWDVQKTPRGFL